ncbi:MAG: ABC transporter permease [Candidatus Lokiarchaeota archaeon]|nr:ABC transporter permease [Candidatus Lokiarchaeota archaeon]
MIIFSIKNAFRKKGTAILASLGVAFGLMLVFVVSAFTAGLKVQFEDNLTRTLGIVNVIETSEIGPESKLPIDIVEKIYATEGIGGSILGYNVETQAPFLFTVEYADKLRNTGDAIALSGLNASIDEEWEGYTTNLIEGRSFIPGQNETIIGTNLRDIAQFPVEIGDIIELTLNPINATRVNLTIVGVYQSINDGTPVFVPQNYFIYTDIQFIWDMLAEVNKTINTYSLVQFRFDVRSNLETNQFVEKINNASENGDFSPTYVSAFALATFYEAVEENLSVIDTFTAVLGVITILAGGMAIIVTQLMSVSSRMKEFAILKATGWKNVHIFVNIILESLTLSLLGAIIGIGIGFGMIFLLSGESSPFGAAPAIVNFIELIKVFVYAISLGILGGLYPGIKAARVRPVVVLKNE